MLLILAVGGFAFWLLKLALEEVEQRAAELERGGGAERQAAVARISAAVSSSLDLNEVLSTATQKVVELFGVEHGGIMILDEKKEWGHVLAEYPDWGATAERFKVKGYPAAQRIIADRKPLMIEDTLRDPLMAKARDTMRRLAIKSVLIVPLLVKGETIGSIGLDAIKERRIFSQEEIELAQTIANQVAIAIENARLYEQTRKHLDELSTLCEVGQEVTSTLDLDAVLQSIVNQAVRVTGAERSFIWLVDAAKRKVTKVVGHGCERGYLEGLTFQEFCDGLAGWVFREKVPTLPTHTLKDERAGQLARARSRRLNTKSVASAPLLTKCEATGVVVIANSAAGPVFDHADLDLIAMLASQAAIAIENARLCEETRQGMEELSPVQEVAGAVAAELALDELLNLVTEATGELLEAETGSVVLINPHGRTRTYGACYGLQAEALRGSVRPVDAGVQGHGIRTGERLLINDLFADKRASHDFAQALGFRSAVIAPLVAKERVTGCVMALNKRAQEPFTTDDLRLLAALATQPAIAIENAGLFQAQETQRRDAQALRQAALALSSALDRNQVMERILARLEEVVPYDSVSLQLLQRHRPLIIGGRGFPNLEELLDISFAVDGDNLNRVVMRTLSPLILEDAPAVYEAFTQEPFAQMDIRSCLGVPVLVSERLVGMITLDKCQPGFYTEEHARLAQAFAAQPAIAIENARLFEELLESFSGAITALATAIDAKDRYARGQSERVAEYPVAIAEELGMEPQKVETIRYAGLLHDIGKIGISKQTLYKPDTLGVEAWEAMRAHPVIGAEILKPMPSLREIVPLVRHHHEHYDGTGYPDGLAGEKIPLGARILAVADAFEVMTSPRSYSPAMSPAQAIAVLTEGAGKQWDTKVVEGLLRALEKERPPPLEGAVSLPRIT